MKYQLTEIKADGSVAQWVQYHEPTLQNLQEAVGGLIEQAPDEYQTQQAFKNIFVEGNIDAVWCNEEALLVADPQPNLFFEPASWGDRLYGDVFVVQKFEV